MDSGGSPSVRELQGSHLAEVAFPKPSLRQWLSTDGETLRFVVPQGAWTCPYAATFQAVFALVCVPVMIAAVSTLGRPWALLMQPLHVLAVIMNVFVSIEYCRMFEWRILEIGPQAWRLTSAWPYEASPYRDCLTGGLSQEFRMQEVSTFHKERHVRPNTPDVTSYHLNVLSRTLCPDRQCVTLAKPGRAFFLDAEKAQAFRADLAWVLKTVEAHVRALPPSDASALATGDLDCSSRHDELCRDYSGLADSDKDDKTADSAV